ncbi:recombination regulator RecX [soil metagenome]
MKITSVKQQVKRSDRYSVYVDGAYSFSLSEAELLKQGLRSGQELSDSELTDLKKDARLDKARLGAFDQLSRRPRSEWELREYLKRKEYDPEVIDKVLAYLLERQYIDDAEFARRWVENRRLLKPVSKRRLIQELKQKRVDETHINTALQEDAADERKVLQELIEKKRRQTKYQDDQKLMQFLARQGFSYDDIKSAVAYTREHE